VAFSMVDWSGEAAGRREERGRKGNVSMVGYFFFVGLGWVVVVFCIKPSPPSCWCFMFSFTLMRASGLQYPSYLSFFARHFSPSANPAR
jgi:hypothetical protein